MCAWGGDTLPSATLIADFPVFLPVGFFRSAGPEGLGGQIQAGASCGRNSRLVSGAVLQFSQADFSLRRENWLSTRGVSIHPLYLSRLADFCSAPQRALAKTGTQRQRRLPASSTGRGRRRCPLDSLPTRNDQGGALDPKAEVALGVCLKKCHHSLALAHFFRAAAARRSDIYARPSGAPDKRKKGRAFRPAPGKLGLHTQLVLFWCGKLQT